MIVKLLTTFIGAYLLGGVVTAGHVWRRAHQQHYPMPAVSAWLVVVLCWLTPRMWFR